MSEMAASIMLFNPTTPPDYHRIISPNVIIPTDTTTAIPVGLLACQRDPLLREIKTSVVNCVVSQSTPSQSSKKSKKSNDRSTVVDTPTLEVILHDTVIFPEGGGQPSDVGTIFTENGQSFPVLEVQRHGGHAVHYVQVKDTELDSQYFIPGREVTVSLVFDRRLDHMSMHTSQHLLSALLETRLNLPTLSWSLTAYPSPCYVELPRPVTIEEIMSTQNEANKLVFEGRKVHVEVEELKREQETDVPKLENGRAVGKALPADYTGGVKRIVIIEGIDRTPCCGTHMPTLHNHQIFIIPQTQQLSRSSMTTTRLYFLAGPRLIAHLSSIHSLLTDVSSKLSCGAPSAPDRVEQVINERGLAEKRVNDIEYELAKSIAKETLQVISSVSTEGTVAVKHLHREEDTTNALGFLSAISTAFVNVVPAQMSYILVLSSSPVSQNTSSTSVVLVLGSDEKRVKETGEGIKQRLGIKGGGKGPRWSGKFVGVWKENREGVAISDVLNTVAG